jgi:light-regulated signal transduction histidine kinase (bacteriophytochrome)
VQAGYCRVAGNPTLLKVLMRNLLDNALRYSPGGSAVQVRLQPVGKGGLRWSVGDEGPGMAEADIARLGERLFRVWPCCSRALPERSRHARRRAGMGNAGEQVLPLQSPIKPWLGCFRVDRRRHALPVARN